MCQGRPRRRFDGRSSPRGPASDQEMSNPLRDSSPRPHPFRGRWGSSSVCDSARLIKDVTRETTTLPRGRGGEWSGLGGASGTRKTHRERSRHSTPKRPWIPCTGDPSTLFYHWDFGNRVTDRVSIDSRYNLKKMTRNNCFRDRVSSVT